MAPSHRFDLFPRRPWRRHREAFYTQLRRKVRWTGVATGIALALIMVGGGWLIDGHHAPRPAATPAADLVRGGAPSPVPVDPTPMRVAADEFPLVALGSVSSTIPPVPLRGPLPLPVARSATRARSELQSSGTPPVPRSAAQRGDALGARYLVQLGTYRLEENARQDQVRYRGLGIDSQVSRLGAYVVLRLPPFATLDDARGAEQGLREHGIQPLVIGPLR